MAVENLIHINNQDKASTLNQAGDKLGTYYLAQNPKYYEPQRSNTFMFYIEGLSNALEIPQNTYAQANAEEVLMLSVQKAFVPNRKVNALELKRGNNTMKFAGTLVSESGSLTLNDFIGAGTKDVMYAWLQKAYDDRTEKVGLQGDYKKDGYVIEYTPDYQVVRTWKLYGCWCNEVTFGEVSHGDATLLTMNATIQYDKAVLDTSDIA